MIPGSFQRNRERTGCVWTGLLLCVVAAAGCAVNPVTGEVGEARYRAHMAALLEDREAYDLADRARRNIEGNSALALRLIDQAIGQQPRESLFYGVKGDILYAAEDEVEAETRVLEAAPGC